MKNSTQFIPSMKWSMSFMLVFTLMITGLMSCSDIEENGITRSEIEDTQQSMSENSANTPPLYIVNGEIVETIKPEGAFFRIKPKYIESIEVLNPEKGIEIYGDAAKNGVLKLELNDMRAALDDLQDKSKKNEVENNTTVPRKSIFVAVEQNPTMIGGAEALYNNLEYPEQCQQAQIEGRVIVSFVVTKQGNVADPEILRGIGGGCDEAALKAVSDLSFKPARQRGKAVNVQYSQPVMFSLSDDGNINKSAEQGAVQGSAMEVRNLQLTADGTLSGEVYSTKENAPLKAANVYISSLERGAATDENGKFRIDNVEKNSGTLRVTFVGYSTTEVNFN